MRIITEPTNLNEIWEQRETPFVELLKIVVDIENEIIAVDSEMHADLEEKLLERGSKQHDLWGANVYPLRNSDDFIEFTALINIRPAQDNKSMEVLDTGNKQRMDKIIRKLLIK